MTILPGKQDRARVRCFLVFALTIAGSWLRIIGINGQSLWFDEVFSRNVAVQLSIPSILRDGVAGDIHPPLYFVLLNAWVHLGGDSAVSLRLLSALYAILTLPAIYQLARLMFGQRAGLIALAFAAFSPLQIAYAQEARQYMLSVLCMACGTIGLIALVRHKWYGLPLYVAGAVAGLYTHYFVGLALIGLHVWLIVFDSARATWRRWLFADLVIAFFFAPQLGTFLGQTQTVLGGFWIASPKLDSPLSTLAFLLLFSYPAGWLATLGEVIVAGVLAISAFDMLRIAPKTVWSYWLACVLALFVSLLLALAISLARSPIYLDRSFTLLSPFLLAALAGGIAHAPRTSPMPILAVVLAALVVVHLISVETNVPDKGKPPFSVAAADVLAQPDALGTPVLHLQDSSYLPMTYYAPELNQELVDLEDRSWLFPNTWEIFRVDRLSRAALADWLADYQGRLRVVVTPDINPPETQTLLKLQQAACSVSTVTYPPGIEVQIFVYTFRLGPCTVFAPDRHR